MTAEIDEDGVEIADADIGIMDEKQRLYTEAEIERLRAENREHALSELAALGQAEEAYGAQLKAEAEIERLRALLKDARDELAASIEADWPEKLREICPSYARKYERDMDLCYRIDAAIIRINAAFIDKEAGE